MNRFSSHDRAIGQDGRCRRLPQQSNTTLFGPLDHPLVQNRPPDTDAALTREFRFGQDGSVDEANAPEDLPVAGRHVDAKFAKGRECQ